MNGRRASRKKTERSDYRCADRRERGGSPVPRRMAELSGRAPTVRRERGQTPRQPARPCWGGAPRFCDGGALLTAKEKSREPQKRPSLSKTGKAWAASRAMDVRTTQ